MWCDRLDQSTFRDPAVIGLMNERFIPLRSMPTASRRWRRCCRSPGYRDDRDRRPGRHDHRHRCRLQGSDGISDGILQRALASNAASTATAAAPAPAPAPVAAPQPPAQPEWMTRDFQEAGKAATNSDYARATSLLKGIIEDGKDRPVQGKARQLLHDLEQQAAGRLALRQATRGQGPAHRSGRYPDRPAPQLPR